MMPKLLHSYLMFVSAAAVSGIDLRFYSELIRFPLKSNPFFVKSMSGSMTEGTEDKGGKGYGSCALIGNLECSVEPSCLGDGYIDCSGGCPGEERELFEFQSVMDDKEKLKADFPAMSEKMTEHAKNQNGSGDDMKTFLQSLKACINFSAETQALLSLVDGPGIGGEELDIQKVDEDAVSGFGSYEYYYEDYESYEDEQHNRTSRDLKWSKGVENNKNFHNLIKLMQKVNLRQKRTLGKEMEETKVPKCIVKNMKCERFPRLDECTGIGLGKCGEYAAILSALSSPHVLMVIVVVLSLLFIAAVSASFYMIINWT